MSKRKKKSSRSPSQAQRSIPASSSQVLSGATPDQADPSGLQEYEYVTKDLKRVTILAAAMFALLVCALVLYRLDERS